MTPGGWWGFGADSRECAAQLASACAAASSPLKLTPQRASIRITAERGVLLFMTGLNIVKSPFGCCFDEQQRGILERRLCVGWRSAAAAEFCCYSGAVLLMLIVTLLLSRLSGSNIKVFGVFFRSNFIRLKYPSWGSVAQLTKSNLGDFMTTGLMPVDWQESANSREFDTGKVWRWTLEISYLWLSHPSPLHQVNIFI